jgi:hypothetical protein
MAFASSVPGGGGAVNGWFQRQESEIKMNERIEISNANKSRLLEELMKVKK